jgi:hypothetical protein
MGCFVDHSNIPVFVTTDMGTLFGG